MSSYDSILARPAALWLLIMALFLMIGQTAVFLIFIREKQSRRHTAAAALHMLIGFLFFVFLLNSYDIVNYPAGQNPSIDSESPLFSLPWLLYAFAELLSAGLLAFHFRTYRRYRKSTVTPDAIRQTIDLLPEGICISTGDGTVLLSNLTMDALCRELTGSRLADAGKLWDRLETNGEDQGGKRLIHTPQGEVWLFSKGTMASSVSFTPSRR